LILAAAARGGLWIVIRKQLGDISHLYAAAARRSITALGRREAADMSHIIDLIEVIFHPTMSRRPTAFLDGSWVEEQGGARQ
jgi:hypothetical protein